MNNEQKRQSLYNEFSCNFSRVVEIPTKFMKLEKLQIVLQNNQETLHFIQHIRDVVQSGLIPIIFVSNLETNISREEILSLVGSIEKLTLHTSTKLQQYILENINVNVTNATEVDVSKQEAYKKLSLEQLLDFAENYTKIEIKKTLGFIDFWNSPYQPALPL